LSNTLLNLLAQFNQIPHDASTNTSDGEGLDRRSSAANSADEDIDRRHRKRRQPRSKHTKRIDASAGRESGYESLGRRAGRARSVTSESGNEDFTGSEFGATVCIAFYNVANTCSFIVVNIQLDI